MTFSLRAKLMRKTLKKKLKSSMSSQETPNESPTMEPTSLPERIECIPEKIVNLKATITALQGKLDRKDKIHASVCREKAKIDHELVKQKRTNSSLIRQLEDERKYYFEEKEVYCREMNDLKRWRQSMSSVSLDAKSVEDYKKQLAELKQTLQETLQANYNLSIKFLRIKNSKTCLKTQLKKMKLDHDKMVNDLKTKIEALSSEIGELITEKLRTAMTPSHRKYLDLVNKNSCLVYENLCLQHDVDRLIHKFNKIKLDQTRSETNSRLKYLKPQEPARKTPSKKQVRINDAPEKLEKAGCSRNEVKTIYERKPTSSSPKIDFTSALSISGTSRKTSKLIRVASDTQLLVKKRV